MSELSDEDIAAAREQGDVVALILMSSGLPVKASKPRSTSATPPSSTPALTRSRPGAWPDGTQSPGLTPEVAAYLAQLWPDRYAPSEENP